ncbi:MAG: HPP family protein [Pseudobdellovibrio sp.]
MNQGINKLFTKDVVYINENASLMDANDIMNNHNFRHLPVVNNENYLVGILSKSDFSALKYVDTRFTGFNVKMVMSSPVKTVSKFTTVSDVAKIFIEQKLNCVVVAGDDELIGIVTSEDLIKLLIEYPAAYKNDDQLDLAALAEEGWISATFN